MVQEHGELRVSPQFSRELAMPSLNWKPVGYRAKRSMAMAAGVFKDYVSDCCQEWTNEHQVTHDGSFDILSIAACVHVMFTCFLDPLATPGHPRLIGPST